MKKVSAPVPIKRTSEPVKHGIVIPLRIGDKVSSALRTKFLDPIFQSYLKLYKGNVSVARKKTEVSLKSYWFLFLEGK